jgi:hypothetical protein
MMPEPSGIDLALQMKEQNPDREALRIDQYGERHPLGS